MTQVLDDFLVDRVTLERRSRSTTSTATTGIVVAGVLALQLAGLGTTPTGWSPGGKERQSNFSITSSGWLSGTVGRSSSNPAVRSPFARASPARNSTSLVIRGLREDSGLTWDQLAKVFGVSRRAAHLWAAGKPMNAGHEELLYRLTTVIKKLPGNTPNEKRAGLLRAQANSRSIYDQIRIERANGPVIQRSSFEHIKNDL